MDPSHTTERQVIGEADRRALEQQEAAQRAAAAGQRKAARKKTDEPAAQADTPKEG